MKGSYLNDPCRSERAGEPDDKPVSDYEAGYQQAIDDVVAHLRSMRDQSQAALRNVEPNGPFAVYRGLQAGWTLQADLAAGMANYFESYRGKRLPQ